MGFGGKFTPVRLSAKESASEWLSGILQRVEGLDAHPGSVPDSLSVTVNGGCQTNFEVLSIPVLSQEKADELVRVWQNSAPSIGRRNRLIATQHLSSATRKLLRTNGISWVEERTGICRAIVLSDMPTHPLRRRTPFQE
jgi:hypothetical protein